MERRVVEVLRRTVLHVDLEPPRQACRPAEQLLVEVVAEAAERLRERALHAGDERSVQRQRDRGKGLARERLERLLDPGSLVELDAFVQHRSSNFGLAERRPYGDGVVTGHGTVHGRKVFVFSQDFTVFGGSLGEAYAEKICKVMDLAVRFGCPVIGINDSAGARIQDAVTSLAWYAELGRRHELLRGLVPEVSIILGKCAGGAVYSPIQTDLVVAVRDQGYMFVTGPDVIKDVTGEDVSLDELGGADAQARYGNDLIRERGFACKAELLAKLAALGARIEEVPVGLDSSRRVGESKMPILRTVLCYWRMMARQRFHRVAA